MGMGPGRARADDELGPHGLRALVVEDLHQIPRDVPLTPPDEMDVEQPLERAVGDLARTAQELELGLVLDRSHRLDDPAARYELEAPAGERLVLRVGQHRLEAHTADQRLGKLGDERALRLHRFDVGNGARLLDVAEVGEEADAIRLDEQLCVRAVEAAEVANVDEVRDEQRLLQPLPQAIDSGHAFSFRYSSASL